MSNNVLRCYGTPSKDTPNVYFCGRKYFDVLYREICKLGKISMWYEKGIFDSNESDRELELERMNLFIIPITNTFLEDLPPRYVKDYEFAIARGIPVLPIAFEPVDDALYASVFGTRHYISYDSKGRGGLSFIEKLDSYLSALLVSPEIVARVKDAFGGRVFLSYRKKDRMHVSSIMRMIHSNENLIDIAVWYDEFLTPGEYFDASIKEKIKESDAFLLSVTPNLLEDGNYVMNSEYPFAFNENMLIVPIEVEKTEKAELQKCYPHIPECKSIEYANEITDIILRQLKERDKPKKSKAVSEPERDYLLGLAYVFGIDVEVDRERGFRLIERAADAGCEEAMHKLSQNNLRGGGIDDRIVRGRQQRYVDICRERYEQIGTVGSACEYADALEALARIENSFTYYDYHNESENAARPVPEASIAMIKLLEDECAKRYSKRLIYRLIDAYETSASFYSGRMRAHASTKNKQKSVELLKRIADAEPYSKIYLKIADVYDSFIADGSISLGNAMLYHVEALNFYRKAYGDDRSIEHLKVYFRLCDSIGDDAFYCGWDDERQRGREYWIQALSIMEEIFAKQPTAENARVLCERYLHYCEELGERMDRFYAFDAETRLRYCRRGITLCEKCFDISSDKNAKRTLILLHLFAADAYYELGKYKDALKNYRASMDLFDAETINAPCYYRIYTNPGDVLEKGGLGCFKSLERLGKMDEANAYAYYLLASFELQVSDYETFIDAWISHKDSYALKQFLGQGLNSYCDGVFAKADQNKYWREKWLNDLFGRCFKAYEICLAANLGFVAVTYLSTSAAALKKTALKSRDQIYDLVKICMNIGDMCLDHHTDADAYNWYLEGVNNSKRLLEGELSEEDLRLLAFVHIKMGEYHEQNVDLDPAEDNYVYALKCMLKVYTITKNKAEIDCAIEKLTNLYGKQGNIFYVLKKSLELSKMIRNGQ